MRVIDLGLGVLGIKWEAHIDERGEFTRLWDVSAFSQIGPIAQVSRAKNRHEGTLRGLHFQIPPSQETKVVYCLRGRVFDVVIQVDPKKEDFGKKICVEISENGEMNGLIVPRGFAHGYLTLEANTELIYLMDAPYSSENSRVINCQDKYLAIPWPAAIIHTSKRDMASPDWKQYFNM